MASIWWHYETYAHGLLVVPIILYMVWSRREDVAVLEPVRDYKARHASTLLTFDAVVAAIEEIEHRRSAASAPAANA